MRWSRFFRRNASDRERADELTAYLEIETGDNIARGMSDGEARILSPPRRVAVVR